MPVAQVKVYVIDPAVQVEVIAGSPPVDQSAEVASLTQQVADLQAAKATLQGKLDQLKAKAQARKDADEATIDGQDELDIIG